MKEFREEITSQNDVVGKNSNEITLGDAKYLHTSDEEHDYLFRITESGVKVTLQFTKDKEKHEKAMEAIKTFFSWL